MTRQRIPDDVLSAAHARSKARAARDWPEADRLRAAIEAAGWRIVDRGTDFALSPAAAADETDGGRVRYGSSRSVPSRLEEPSTGLATIVLLATDWPDDLRRALDGLRTTAAGRNVGRDRRRRPVGGAGRGPRRVGNGPVAGRRSSAEDDPPIEIVWTSERLGHAAAVNAGMRRATAPVAVLMDTSVEPTGDIVTPLVQALDDPSVAVAGGWGITSGDLRKFEDAPAGEVDAIEGYLQAFRRADYAARGPLDERFRFYRNLDIWWSLVLRDEGEGSAPRRAVRLDGLPAVRHEHRG